MTIYFGNLTVKLNVLYIFNTQVKFRANQIYLPFNPKIYFLRINLYYKNLKFKYLIDNITMIFKIL